MIAQAGLHERLSSRLALPVAGALHHLHVLGPTGTGKTTLLAHLINQDIAAGHGVVVIEPKGDLVDDVLARVPADTAMTTSSSSTRTTPRRSA